MKVYNVRWRDRNGYFYEEQFCAPSITGAVIRWQDVMGWQADLLEITEIKLFLESDR